MASGMTNKAVEEVATGVLDLNNDTLKVMLVDTAYVFDPDVNIVDPDDDSVNDAHHHEIVATNYIRGFGGTRKVVNTSFVVDDPNNMAEVVISDVVWTNLGNGVNDTVGAVLLIKEGTSDLDSRVIACFDVVDTATDGNNFTVNFWTSPDGNIKVRNYP